MQSAVSRRQLAASYNLNRHHVLMMRLHISQRKLWWHGNPGGELLSLFTAALSIHNVYKEGSCCFYFSPRQLPLSRGVLKGGDLLFLPLSLSRSNV